MSRLWNCCRQVKSTKKKLENAGCQRAPNQANLAAAPHRRLAVVNQQEARANFQSACWRNNQDSRDKDGWRTLSRLLPDTRGREIGRASWQRLSVENARQLMVIADYWKLRKSAAICVHPMRERRARLGELVQIEGSPHDWFEGRADRCTLLVFIDDAAGKLLQQRFAPTETTLGYACPAWPYRGTCAACGTLQ